MPGQPGGGFMQLLIMLGLMFVIFYFFLVRPQQRKQKEHEQMIKSLRKGDRVVTNSGIHGFIEGIRDDGTIMLKVAEGVKIQFSKNSVAYVKKKEGEVDQDKEAGKEK